MELGQSRMVTNDITALARFYARLVAATVALNQFCVEVPTGGQSVGWIDPVTLP